jgi:uncharacterized membrane protein YqhA
MDIIILIVILLAVGAILSISRLSHLKHKLSIIGVLVLCLFLFITFMSVANSNSVKINSFGNFFTAIQLYFSWLGHVLGNLGTLTGNAIRMDWFGNSTG